MFRKIIQLIILLLATGGRAQIIYHDLIPDVTFTTSDPPGTADNLCPIDLNGDGSKEFDFRWDAWNAGSSLIWFIHFYSNPGSSPTRQFITNPSSSMLKPLQPGEAITPAQTYTNMFDPMLSTTGNNNFQGLGERYIGFRANVSGTMYYGWVRVTLENFTTTVKDYAYTADPNGLNAGQTTLELNDYTRPDAVVVTPNPANGFVRVDHPDITGESFQYDLIDVSGKKILSGVSGFGEDINLSTIATGNYLLKISQGEKSLVKRFVKQ